MRGPWGRNESGAVRRARAVVFAGLAALALSGCAPTVKLQAPPEPITINMNIKIEHEIRVKVDRELEELFDEKSGDIF
jgi:hypothetical protein